MNRPTVIELARKLSMGPFNKQSYDDTFAESNPDYRSFLEALRETTDPAALRDFLIEPDNFEFQHVSYAGLRRLAELVEDDAYLCLRIHRIAHLALTARSEDKYRYIDMAALLAPDDPLVLWQQVLLGPAIYVEVASFLHRLAAVSPDDPKVAEAIAALEPPGLRHVELDVRNSLQDRVPNIRDVPGEAIFARLRPKQTT